MIPAHIRRYFRTQTIATSLAGLLVGMVIDVFSNWLAGPWGTYFPWFVGIAAALLMTRMLIVWKRQPGIEVQIYSPHTAATVQEAELYARRGFVGFVPILTQQGSLRLPAGELKEAIQNLEFDRLNLLESNLLPMIKAIMTHQSRLEHCWLVSTHGKKNPGSLPVARLLVAYLRQECNMKCEFYYEEYSILMDRDTQVLTNSYDLIRKIFSEADKKNLPASEMIADITSGIRSMPLGMVLACLDRDRDVEFMGCEYDEATGRPIQDTLVPIRFSFEPQVE